MTLIQEIEIPIERRSGQRRTAERVAINLVVINAAMFILGLAIARFFG